MKTRSTIARGVALLDETVPGWEHDIKLDTLDLSSICGCVCGQIAKREGKFMSREGKFMSRYIAGLALLGLEARDGAEYGFALATGVYAKLTDEWTRVIRAKRRGEEITS